MSVLFKLDNDATQSMWSNDFDNLCYKLNLNARWDSSVDLDVYTGAALILYMEGKVQPVPIDTISDADVSRAIEALATSLVPEPQDYTVPTEWEWNDDDSTVVFNEDDETKRHCNSLVYAPIHSDGEHSKQPKPYKVVLKVLDI